MTTDPAIIAAQREAMENYAQAYADDYEMAEGRAPKPGERVMITDAIMGLIADPEFIARARALLAALPEATEQTAHPAPEVPLAYSEDVARMRVEGAYRDTIASQPASGSAEVAAPANLHCPICDSGRNVSCTMSNCPRQQREEQKRAAPTPPAAASAAPKDEASERTARELEIAGYERDHAQACLEHCINNLAAIHGAIYPKLHTVDGKTYRFTAPDPHLYLQALADAIRAIPDTLATVADRASRDATSAKDAA